MFLVVWWVECRSVIFRRFRQSTLFLAGDKSTVYQKDGFCHSGFCELWGWIMIRGIRVAATKWQQANGAKQCNSGRPTTVRNRQHKKCEKVRKRSKNQTPPSYGFGRYGFGFFGPRIAFRATGALWGRATPFFYHFSVHLSSVLGRTELCHEVWTPGPQKPQIISNENHHLALLEKSAKTSAVSQTRSF